MNKCDSFPVMQKDRNLRPGSIPWSMLAPHEAQVKKNHGGHSILELSKRGGLSPCELLAALEDRPWQKIDSEICNTKIMDLMAAYYQVQAGRVLTCVYCGQEYPAGTPASGSEVQVLTDHIKICEKHPMRKAEAKIAKLRQALAGLIGAETSDELRQMEAAMRFVPAPEADKAISLNAIHVLLETMEEGS